MSPDLAATCPLAAEFHTHLLCPSCGSETTRNGYYSAWRCCVCGDLNAQAIFVCGPDGTRVVDQTTGTGATVYDGDEPGRPKYHHGDAG